MNFDDVGFENGCEFNCFHNVVKLKNFASAAMKIKISQKTGIFPSKL